MRIDIPVLLTPKNIIGLSHAATQLQMSRKMDFTDEDAFLFSDTNTGADKNNFIINYELNTAQVAYVRYKIIFQNGLTGNWSPITMISNNNARKQEYTLDVYSAIPATPKVRIKDYNHSNVPHTNITIESDLLSFYVGTGEHISSSWYLLDKEDNIKWSSVDNEFSLNSISIDKKEFSKDGIYKIGLEKNVLCNGATFKTLMGIKLFNATDENSIDERDRSLEIDLDSFVLYSAGQSVLEFNHGISDFQYLSIKLYDRNGILTGDEVKATSSPAYINTSKIESGRSYRMQMIAFYLDGDGNIRNTIIRDKNFIAQKYTLSDVVPNISYGNYDSVGFHEVKGYQDEDSNYFNYASSFLDGSSAIYIKEGLIFLGYWLEGGYVLNNKFININSLALEKFARVQIMQKQNGNFLLIGEIVVSSVSKVKIVEFSLLPAKDNVSNISIIISYLSATNTSLLLSSLLLNNNNRILFSNTSSANALCLFKPKTTDLWGAINATFVIYELKSNSFFSRHSYNTNGYCRVCELALVNNLAQVDLCKIVADDSYTLKVNYYNIFNMENIVKTLALSLNTIVNSTHPVMIDLKTNLFDLGLHTSGLDISLVATDAENLLMTIKDIKTNGSFYKHYRFNITNSTWHMVHDDTGAGKDHTNMVTAEYNIYRTIKGKPPLRLK